MITPGVTPVLLPQRRVANPPRPPTSHDFAEALALALRELASLVPGNEGYSLAIL